MSAEDIKEIEVTIDQAKEQVERMEALDRLRQNKDWKNIIEEGYFEKEASRLVCALGEPALQEDKQQEQLQNMMKGVTWFRQYLNSIYMFGRQAQQAMPSYEQTREEIYNEQ